MSSPDLRFLDSLATALTSLVLFEGGEDEDPRRNLSDGILGFLASSARR